MGQELQPRLFIVCWSLDAGMCSDLFMVLIVSDWMSCRIGGWITNGSCWRPCKRATLAEDPEEFKDGGKRSTAPVWLVKKFCTGKKKVHRRQENREENTATCFWDSSKKNLGSFICHPKA